MPAMKTRQMLFGALTALVMAGAAAPSLEAGFQNPPKANRPQVWWWFEAGAPREAITRDLEGLARVGVSGFHVYGGDPATALWVEKVKWALHEAARLGLDGVVCIGAAGCGHWKTDPRLAQKDVTFTKVSAIGGGTLRARLPKTGLANVPKEKDGLAFYRDVAVLAVPTAPDFVPVEAVRDVTRFFDPATDTLAWPDAPAVGEAAMCRLRELVEAGATLAGARPSGPTGMNESSARYHAAADALWGPRGSKSPARRTVGKGYVFRDRPAARAGLAERGIGPDFAVEGLPPEKAGDIDWIHRTTGTNEIYFVSNQGGEAVAFTAVFRQTDAGAVALWDAVTGRRTRLAVTGDGRTVRARLALPPFGSAFVVFGPGGGPAPERPSPTPAGTLEGPWRVRFDPAWGGPREVQTWPALVDWTTRPEAGIRFYSGTAVYRTTFDAPADWTAGWAVRLDLGKVGVLAEVAVNGRELGIAWTAPFALPVGTVLKAKGNELEVRVTNLWPNRLIRDAGLPERERLTRTNLNPYKPGDALLPSGLFGPVTLAFE